MLCLLTALESPFHHGFNHVDYRVSTLACFRLCFWIVDLLGILSHVDPHTHSRRVTFIINTLRRAVIRKSASHRTTSHQHLIDYFPITSLRIVLYLFFLFNTEYKIRLGVIQRRCIKKKTFINEIIVTFLSL